MADRANSRGGFHDDSPPRTPRAGFGRPQRSNAAMRALNTRPTQQETFFDDSTPVDNSRTDDVEFDRMRDSHDLSFGGGARNSIVDNMLLSLDQFSSPSFNDPAALYSNLDNEDFFLTQDHYALPQPHRTRGHTHTSSYSSDYDLHPDDTSSRYSSHPSRGRRSNSSSNFPVRKASLRGFMNGRNKEISKGSTGEFPPSSHANHSRGVAGKGSKSSGSSSVDFGYSQVLGTHRLGFGKRSASFDNGYSQAKTSVKGDSILDRGRPQFGPYHSYDAAPEPTIPAGPRRLQEPPPSSPAFPPQPAYPPPQAPASQRRNSIRSSTSRTLRKNKSQPEPNMRMQAQEFVNASSFRDLPPIPAFSDPPAPSPTVATRKNSAMSPSVPVSTPKEKPGFFRRVFGSSKSSQQSSQHEASPLASQNRGATSQSYGVESSNRPRTTQANSHQGGSQLKSLPTPPHTAVPPSKGQQPSHTLNKKPSSFFRRRKKSVSEISRPPPVPVELKPPKPEIAPAIPSPSISSLRQVMNPYLSDLASPAERFYESREFQPVGEAGAKEEHGNGFSPGYKPHKDATVRTVKPSSRDTNNTSPSSRENAKRDSQALNGETQKLKLKVKRGRTPLANPHDDSFLADSSGNEDRSGAVTPSGRSSTFGLPDETRRPKTSPTSSPALIQSPTPRSNPEHEAPQRRANVGEKRSELLSPKGSESAKPSSPSASEAEVEVEDDSWVLTTPTKEEGTPQTASARSNRVWLDTTSAEDKKSDDPELLSLPLEGAKTSQVSSEKTSPQSSANEVFQSATSLPIVQVEGGDVDAMTENDQSHVADDEPTEVDTDRAFKIFTGDEEVVTKAQAASFLGDVSLKSARTRKAYMVLFDWTGYNILFAMRDLCSRLVLKAETQQVDRILMAFSERWCECNPNHGFKATDVVHTICYSVLLLNTDLHMAEIESRMTRNQFVKNTLPTIRRVCVEAIKEAADETLRPRSIQVRGSIPWQQDRSEPSSPAAESTSFLGEGTERRASLENKRSRSRLSIKPPPRSGSDGLLQTPESASPDNCTVLVNAPYNGPIKGWEYQVEIVLKEFYNSIRQQRLPLHGASSIQTHDQPSSNSLSVSGMLRRTPSVLSKAPSDTLSFRGRAASDFRSVGARFQSKTRSRPRLYPSSTIGSSRTSLDDNSVWSPAGSSTWSRYSFGKTQTSMSMESLGSHFAHDGYQQSIGFANALSQAIIREEGMTIKSDEEFTRVAPLLEDESLELIGAPWAKEGILKHKHHLESLDKKAKDRTWNECFAVIEKGYMRLFSFSMNSKSMRHKNRSRPSAGSIVGGGNWMDNAEALDSFLLRQSIASALPPPGYSKNRPHVFALSLPTGAVHLFQVGTPEIVKEFVSTANYWSARLSKEPLMGGVSSMEYGWGEGVVNPALIRQDSTPSTNGHVPRPSMTSSIRSSVDHATGTVKARLPGDKISLSDWNPPTQSMMASNLMEVDQLKALTNYVKNVEEELARHNELRAPMLIAFSPRHPNAGKAMANWERKSSYLLREIVKFRTYIDSLTAAQTYKEKIYAEREAEAAKDEADGDISPSAGPAFQHDGAVKAPESSEPITA